MVLCSHEAGATSDHNVLDIGMRLKLGAARQDGRTLPDVGVLEEVVAHVAGVIVA